MSCNKKIKVIKSIGYGTMDFPESIDENFMKICQKLDFHKGHPFRLLILYSRYKQT